MSFPRPVYFRWGYDYWHQLPDGRVALGGMRDAGGEDEWTGEAHSAEPIQSGLEALLRRLGVTAPVTHRWAACVAYSNDGLPYIGQIRPGVWVTGAYSGTGNLIGSLCGRGLAQLVATGETTLLSELMRPSHACASGPS